VLLNRNTALFANTIYQFTPEVRVSLEYRHMVTRPFDGTTRRNDNVSLGIAYSF
jgi:predicted porin